MSDRMTGMSFDQLMNWVTEELENHGTLFGLHRAYKAPEEALTIFGRDLETPIGPAAGPNSQLAQNISGRPLKHPSAPLPAPTPSWPRTSWRATSAVPGSLN